MSGLLLTVAFIFATGMAVGSATSVHEGARLGLLIISVIVGLVAIAGVRVINARPLFTPWLVLGALPAFGGTQIGGAKFDGATGIPDQVVALLNDAFEGREGSVVPEAPAP